jgi:2-polyprenyl-3-methyl-5-hydroxy-6-metoxy-1,4-benzoquinol methylase
MVGSGKVLDVGCGTGFMLSSLQSPNRQLYGIDISTSAIKIAKASVVEANFYVSDVRNIPFEANTFDWLICIDTLEHIEGNATVKECLRILKPGGKALFSAPNKNGPGDWHTPGHVNAFTFASFTKYIEQVGFEVTSARKMILYVPILTYTATVLSLALKKNIPLAHGLDISVPEPLASIFFIEAHKRSI